MACGEIVCCPLSPTSDPLTRPHRPGGWIGEHCSTNWGSVCVFVEDQFRRKYAVTARHVAGVEGEDVCGKRLAMPVEIGCRGLTLEGEVVRHTSMHWLYADAVLVELRAGWERFLSNQPYGSSERVRRVAKRPCTYGTTLRFHGARTALASPKIGTVLSTHSSLDAVTLPGRAEWLEVTLGLSRGDSGGLFVSEDGEEAVAMLQLGEFSNPYECVARTVFGVPLALVLAQFEELASSGTSLPGYESLHLQLYEEDQS